MKAHELKEELRKGKYIIAAFGNISLWDGIDRERTIHPNVFRALIKEGVLHEECVENGASRFELKTPTEKEILEARLEELEEEIKNSKEEADRLEDFSNFAISYLIERVNDLLEKTGEQGSDTESWGKELKRLYMLNAEE